MIKLPSSQHHWNTIMQNRQIWEKLIIRISKGLATLKHHNVEVGKKENPAKQNLPGRYE